MTRPRFTLREAAAACGVSLSTIRRRRESGEFPGAVKEDGRGWTVPVEDLLAAGLKVNAPAPPDEVPADEPGLSGGERARLLQQLAEETHRRELVEAEARHLRETVARQETHVADLRRAMLALTSGPPSNWERSQQPAVDVDQGDLAEQSVSVPEQPRAGRWWNRSEPRHRRR